MNGAREYARIVGTGQYGRLYTLAGEHARGRTFHVYVLPEGERADVRYYGHPPCNHGTVEVYGIIGGQLGWSESYGWLCRGPWEADFEAIVATRKREHEEREAAWQKAKEERDAAEHARRLSLLASY